MLAFLINVDHLVTVAGYPLVFAIVMAESGGVPIPGETALLTASVLASQGKLQIVFVIAAAAAGAIVGDNIGYLIGRKGGRWLLQRPGPFLRQRVEVLTVGEPFFAKHGPKAVFFGRFILGLRTWASWLAGATRMHWRLFAIWNALGGIGWATSYGLLAYFGGKAAGGTIIKDLGLYGILATVIAVGGAYLLHRRHAKSSAGAGAGADTGAGTGAGAGAGADTGAGTGADADTGAGTGADADTGADAGADISEEAATARIPPDASDD
jgi:membrane protein DedA with SNARE-associated domain